MSIKIVENNIPKAMSQLDDVTELILTKIGMKIEKFAKALCPVGTPESTGWKDKKGKLHPNKGYRGGTLRNSITYEVNGDELVAGSNVEYAPYVELGTGQYFTPPPSWIEINAKKGSGIGHSFVKPRPYLRPAVEQHIAEYKKIIETELKK